MSVEALQGFLLLGDFGPDIADFLPAAVCFRLGEELMEFLQPGFASGDVRLDLNDFPIGELAFCADCGPTGFASAGGLSRSRGAAAAPDKTGAAVWAESAIPTALPFSTKSKYVS